MATGIILANSFPTPPPLSSSSLISLQALLRRLHLRISHYRPLILPFFQDFDHQHTGTVTHDQFARVLTLVKTELKREELTLLTHFYLASDISQVDYRRFLHDVDDDHNPTYKAEEECKETLREADVTRTNRSITAYPHTPPPTTPPSLSLLTQKVQTVVSQRRHSISDLFDDFDPLRKRTVTPTQFQRCLDVSGLALTGEEVEVLLKAYTRGGVVYYREFILSITTAFIPHQAELQPTSTPPTFTPYSLHTLSPSDSTTPLSHLLTRMAYLTSTRRILLKPAFAAHDRAHDGCCSGAAFCGVLSGVFPSLALSGEEMKAVSVEYERGGKGVGYVDFCAEVERREAAYENQHARTAQLNETSVTDHNQTFPSPHSASTLTSSTLLTSVSLTTASPLASPFTSTLSQPLPTLEALLASLRVTLREHRLDLTGAFDDFDRLRRGSVGRVVLFRVLSQWGLRVREEEVELIAEGFPCQGAGREGEVNYAAFLDALSFIPRV